MLKLFITRFTPGAGGRLLSTVLQTSDDICHWSEVAQQAKGTSVFYDVMMEYIRRGFPTNPKYHVMHEPTAPYNTELYSASFDRGNDISMDNLVDHASAVGDNRLLALIGSDMMCNLVFHKSSLPPCCKNANAVTILVNDDDRQWLANALWYKHFYVDGMDRIHHIPYDPSYCNIESLPQVLAYKNKYEYAVSDQEDVYQRYILDNHTTDAYLDKENFRLGDRELGLKNHFIQLSDFFDTSVFVKSVGGIFEECGLTGFNEKLICDIHELWWGRNAMY
jgi:hypothetical protein